VNTVSADVAGSPPRPDALTPRVVRVLANRRQTHDTVTLDLDVGDHATPFEPGQFNMVYAHGVGEAAISISSSPGDRRSLSHTLRTVGAVTTALAQCNPGDVVGLRGPYGRPWPLSQAHDGDLVVVAGGIGLAPARPAVAQALEQRSRHRRLILVVGAQTPADLPFSDDLEAWTHDDRIELHLTVDRAERGWRGSVGVVTKPLARLDLDPERTTILTCGPEIMMDAVARAAIARGVASDRIHVTLERNMRCAVATCGHCQLGTELLCRDGPVFAWPEVADLLQVRQL